MTHEEFQLAAGADPTRLSPPLREHLAACAECAAYHAELLELEALLRPALEVPVPVAPALRAPVAPAAPSPWPYGLAAAAALVAVLVTSLVTVLPGQALARSVAEHVAGEPAAFAAELPVTDAQLAGVLERSHIGLLPGGPTVTYAASCQLRGHTVPHLAVRAAHGPVVVMVLAQETIGARRTFQENGYRGVLVPAAHGALAIVGADPRDYDEVVSAVAARIRYGDDSAAPQAAAP